MRNSAILFASLAVLAACSSTTPNLRPERVRGSGPRAAERTTLKDLEPFLNDTRKDYPLYPGDVIRIEVRGEDLTVERKIPLDGQVPLVGIHDEDGSPAVVKASELRIPELEAKLTGIYSREIPKPYVTVAVVQYAPKPIYVAGAVANPKEYPLPNDRRISLVQALTMAGWFTENAAQDRVRIIRVDPTTGERIYAKPIDVQAMISEGDVKMDVLLNPYDTITVDSKASQSVYVFGHVEEPGEVPYVRGMTLSRLITRAGGLRDFAATTNIRVLRYDDTGTSHVHRVDLKAILNNEGSDFPLEPGDVVYVDETFL